MTIELVAPAVLALVAGCLGGWLRRRIPPRAGVGLLTLVALMAATAVVWGLLLVVVGGLLGVPGVLARLQWCEEVPRAGHQAPPLVALAAALALGTGVFRGVAFEIRWRRTVDAHSAVSGVEVLDVDEPVAFSVAGTGRVVLSRGLLAVLDPREQQAVLAHEQCHLDRRHHRFLRAVGLAGAVVPMLSRLAANVRFATEREADEAAAAAVGDRITVARAIAAAATGARVGGPAMAMADHAVTQRVEELLRPRTTAWVPLAAVVAALGANLVALSSSTMQLHHLVLFWAHVCGLG